MHSILVLSDIHGDIDTLNLILEKENYDYVFFLGDAIDYYWKEENKEVIDKLSNISKILFSVKGNCDNFHTPYNNPLIQRITIDNISISTGGLPELLIGLRDINPTNNTLRIYPKTYA